MRTLTVLSLILLAVSFQNCTQASFTSESSLSSKASGFEVEEGDEGNGRIPANGLPGREICTEDGIQTLYAGQHHDVGQVRAVRNGDLLTVTIVLEPSVTTSEVHINVGTSFASTAGAPGLFPYKGENLGALSSYTVTIDLRNHNIGANQSVFLAVHAVVAPVAGAEDQVINGEETAWAEGARYGGGWQMVFEYTPNGCPE